MTTIATANQLKKVRDLAYKPAGFNNGSSGTGEDYAYDENGNVTKDANKNISEISFNYLNLPETITVTNTGKITFVYSASGKKQKKIIENSNSATQETAYAGKFIYTKENNSLDYELTFFSTSQGYVEPKANGFQFVYQYKDHQGNIKVSYADINGDGQINTDTSDPYCEIVQAKNYYPFGLDHNYGVNSPMSLITQRNHKYAYNGQEQLEDLGVNVTEMTWRQYDNALGRFHGVDALAASTPHVSPYHFAGNNPIVFADPSGLSMQQWDRDYRLEWLLL